MNLKDDRQQNIQIEGDFSSALAGETREAKGKALSRPGQRIQSVAFRKKQSYTIRFVIFI